MAHDNESSKQIVLSEALTNAIGARRVKAAVFTTFEFEPDFFELHILPCLFADTAWSHVPNVKRVQVGKALESLEHIAVFYDRHGLRPEGGSSRLDYHRVPLTRTRGVFHAKNILLLVENPGDAGEAWDSLIVVTTSANLTRSGWHENLEIAHVVEVKPEDRCALREDLLHQRGLLSVLENATPDRERQPAVGELRRFLRDQTVNPAHRKHRGLLLPRLYVGRERFAEFIRTAGRIAPGEYHLEIISPFFENTADASTLSDLLDTVQPIQTRIYLPLGEDRTALCSEEYFRAVEAMENVFWSALPPEMTRWSRKSHSCRERHVHAKVYRLVKRGRASEDWRDVQVIGSVNLTGAAHAGRADRNFETAILLDLPCPRRPEWWLDRLESSPEAFEPRVPEDAATLAWHELTLRFDWCTDRLAYFWKAEPRGVEFATVLAHGCPLFDFEQIRFDEWRELGDQARRAIREHLKGTSLVMLAVGDEPPQPLLVQEAGMSRKPPLLEQLTPAEILEYWSLLTPDQRNDFIDRKIREKLEQTEHRPEPSPRTAPDSLFDRFAGIFHAFSCLEEHVLQAMKHGTKKEIQYRLVGTSYDSLPTLVNQVRASPDADPVAGYVTLLCACSVFERLRRQAQRDGIWSEVLDATEVSRLSKQWKADREHIRSRIAWDGQPDPAAFFDWYEKAFASPGKPIRHEHSD